jgi:hypothetical protein
MPAARPEPRSCARPASPPPSSPRSPERTVYNNALLEHDLAAAERVHALDAEAAYAAAAVTRFAAWVHETGDAMRTERRGYPLDTSTRAMGMALDDIRLPRPHIELGPPDWLEHLRIAGVPPNFLGGADHAAFHLLVGTVEHTRRRGLGTAVTALHLHDALARGCQTASLQSTDMAERVYIAVDFRDLRRILEYVP